MLGILGLVNVMLLLPLADVSTQAIGYQGSKIVQRGKRDLFLNPERSCDPSTCRKYQSTIVGGDCESDSCCTCRCQGENTTYVEHTHQCMSFTSIREMVTPQSNEEIQYLLGKPAESCTETCRKSGSTCLSNGHGFTNSSTTLSIFRSLNVVCKTGFSDNYDQYKHKDSPSYYTGKDLKPIGRCIGYKGVPETINCTRGHNVNVQRLCPCQEYTGCRYWLVEHQGTPLDSSSCSNTPIIDLRSTGSLRLSICNHGNHSLTTTGQLLMCTVEEFTYLRGSQWLTVTDEGKKIFDVVVEQPIANNGVLKAEKDKTRTFEEQCNPYSLWEKSLDNKYNGIVGFIKVECKLNGGRLPACFIFKSIGNDIKTTQTQSTSIIPVVTKSKPNDIGDFDEKKHNNVSLTTIAVAVTASVVLLIVISPLAVLITCKRRTRREEAPYKTTQCNSYEVAQVNNQPKTGRHNITLIASADPSFTQNADVTSLRICNNNGKRTEDKNPVISEYEKLHRKKRDLYQSLTHHQPGRCTGDNEQTSDYQNMEGPVQPYQASGIKETRQEDQGVYADYELMRDYVDVTT